jgi:putative FmdB family regulatory protein
MPIYEYRCKKCRKQIEVLMRSTDKPPTRCRECGGGLEKLISSAAIQFKGEGWYVTDYARKGSVAEKVEKELSSDTSSDKSAGGDKEKPKKAAKKTEKA